MAEERQVKRWVTVNGKHIPIYEDTDDWMPADMKARYSTFIDMPELQKHLDSDEKTWVAALKAEREEKQKQSQIQRSADEAKKLNEQDKKEIIKPLSKSEQQRTKEMSKFISDKLNAGEEFGEFYEENDVEELYTESLNFEGFKDDEISITKMNLVYSQNWDENDNRVKRGKALPGSNYYVVQTNDGSIDESNFAYKTKADAEHAMKIYIKELVDWRVKNGHNRRK